MRSALALGLFIMAGLRSVNALPPPLTTIPSTHPKVFLHGRWDENVGSWWAGTGFKLNISNLHNLYLHLGELTTQPLVAAAVSIGGRPYFTANLSAGDNVIPLGEEIVEKEPLEINIEGWQNNRIEFKSLALNADATLLPYNPKDRVIQFVGDSLSAGQFLPLGVNQAWPSLVARTLNAEAKINAQPGATFIDMESYGNVHGVSYQFFKTEDTGYIWTEDHNYTTPWEVENEDPKTTDLVIHIGANDASHGVLPERFIETYLTFLEKLTSASPALKNIHILTPFGWPHEGDVVDYYYDGVYAQVVEQWTRVAELGSFKSTPRTHLVDCTGWIKFADVFPDNVHPNVQGHQKIADKVVQILQSE